MKADKIFLGNIITMDKHRPYAEALTIVNGRITYVGDKDVAEKLCDDKTKVYDYTGKYIYPGFMEAHCHPGLTGQRAIMQANLWDGESMEDFANTMKQFIKDNPGKKYYVGSGWFEIDGVLPEAKYLDEVSTEVPVIMQTRDGHSMLLNHKAMEVFGINAEYAKKRLPGEIKIYDNGEPTGYISEVPVQEIMKKTAGTVEEMKECVLWWQDCFLGYGFTAAGNAGVELSTENEILAFDELAKEGKLKIYSYAWSVIPDHSDTPKKDVDAIADKMQKFNGERFSILGPKIFLDGVIEGHTGWLLEEYADEPGYYGVQRYSNKEILKKLITEAEAKGMSVHAHTIGDAAVKCFLDVACKVQEETGNMDMRNVAAHLQLVRPEDIPKFGKYNIVPASGLIWASNDHEDYYQEIKYIGEERTARGYPAKSFIKTNARMVTHTDYPVSSMVDPVWIVSALTMGIWPGRAREDIRNKDELLTREEAIEALTINVAYEFKKENDLGSLEIGKIGNMTIYDTDFINCPEDKIWDAKFVATVIDGEVCG